MSPAEETYLQCDCGDLVYKRGQVECIRCRIKDHVEHCTCPDCKAWNLAHENLHQINFKPPVQAPAEVKEPLDNWMHRSSGMKCSTCMWYMPKRPASQAAGDHPGDGIGRCRKHAPTLGGWPVMKFSDWCGDHKLDEEKING